MASEPGPGAAHGRRRWRRGSIVGPVILITVGLLFLLNNLGVLPWTVWSSLLRFWPAILILIGLDVLIGRRTLGGAVAALVVSALVIALFVWLAATTAPAGLTAGEGMAFEHRLDGARSAEVRLSPATDRLFVSGAASPADLVYAMVTRAHLADLAAIQDNYHLRPDGVAEFSLNDAGVGSVIPPPANGKWEVSLTTSIPIALRIDSGVSGSTIDLSKLDITRLDINSGIGQTTVTLPEKAGTAGSVSGGIGEIRVRVPVGANISVKASVGVGAVNIPPGWTRAGDYWHSPWHAGEATTLDINEGVGSVVVEEER
jgi:hypothetical protein